MSTYRFRWMWTSSVVAVGLTNHGDPDGAPALGDGSLVWEKRGPEIRNIGFRQGKGSPGTFGSRDWHRRWAEGGGQRRGVDILICIRVAFMITV